MAIGENGEVLGQVRALCAVGAVGALTDGQLLERFATGRGESPAAAFAALVDRHGPMVLRVCRGLLAEPSDAEDAFQATFLVLVRRARSLWVRDSLGPWLHQVAYRTASCLRSSAARRRRLERRAAETSREGRGGVGEELVRVLHEELGRLPERYRAPVVLCDLGASTHEQAARHLGWPVGTVKTRLTRAREILRDRLRRRGFGPDLGLIAPALRPRGIEALCAPALVESTTRAVIQSASARTVLPGSSATLAREVLRTMTIARWGKVGSALAVALATASGVVSLAQVPGDGPRPDQKPAAVRADDLPTAEVKPGKLRFAVVERGALEAVRATDLLSQIEGMTTIISIRPEGTRVKKGEVVCELDSATLRDKLSNQRIILAQAEANSQNARLSRESAETALREYVEGTFKGEDGALRGSIVVAKSAIRKANARLDRTRHARKRMDVALSGRNGPAPPVDVVADLDIDDRLDAAEQDILRETLALEGAETRLDVLRKFTAERTKGELTVAIEKKKEAELSRQTTLVLERERQVRLERQIKACTMLAPADGIVVYANDPGRFGRVGVQIEEGATVRERQKIVSIIDVKGPTRVNVKVPEAWVHRVRRGQKARIKVDAFADLTLNGEVLSVSPLPDPNRSFEGTKKVYTTLVRIDDGPNGLRPGLSAEVEIPIIERDDVLSVPSAAVLHFDDKDHVAVKTPGGFEWRDVALGEVNDASVEIKQGLKGGESVILNPAALMSEEERRSKFSAPTPTRGPAGPGKPGAPAGVAPHLDRMAWPRLRGHVRRERPGLSSKTWPRSRGHATRARRKGRELFRA